jgi:hypothetical protein
MTTSIDQAVKSYESVKGYERVQKAIEFKQAYRAETGHRPSLVSIIALWQDAEAEVARLKALLGLS